MRTWALSFAVLLTTACDSSLNAGNSCNAMTCEGCCTAEGLCRGGDLDTACGARGAECRDCSAQAAVCSAASLCTPAQGSDGGAGGGSGGGSGGGGLQFDGGWNPREWDAGRWDSTNWTGTQLNLTGAEALAVSTINDGGQTLYKISPAGTFTALLNDRRISGIMPVSGGVFVGTADILVDSYTGRSRDVPPNLVGENQRGDLVFADGLALRRSTGTLETIAPLPISSVSILSGNLAVVRFTSGTVQAVNTVTGLRFSIGSCNGPRVAALGPTRALVEDCQPSLLMDTTTGTRSSISIQGFNGPYLEVADGAVFLAQTCPSSTSGNYGVCHVTPAGVVTSLIPGGVPSPSLLLGDGNWFVVRELAQTSLIKRGSGQKTQILAGIDLVSASQRGGTLFYLGFTQAGAPVFGKLDLGTLTNTPLQPPEGMLEVKAMLP